MITPSLAGNHSSFISEAAKVYGLLLSLWHFLEGSTKLTGILKVVCNGKSVLEQLRLYKTTNPFVAHSDLMWASCTLMACMLGKVSLQHMKGHKDNGCPTVLLREAWLDINADSLQKARSNFPTHGAST